MVNDIEPYLDEGFSVLDTVVDESPVVLTSAPASTLARPTPDPFAPAATPPPAPSRVPVAVAGLVGGALLGGVGVAALALLFVGTLGAGTAVWWISADSGVAVAAKSAAPIEAVVTLDEVADDGAANLDDSDEDVADTGADDGVAAADDTVDESQGTPAGNDAEDLDEAPRDATDAGTDAPRPTPAPTSPSPVAPTAAPSAAAPVAARSVKLLSNPPAAIVLVDGVNVGRTPLKTELPPGTHTITIESGKAKGTFTVDTSDDNRFCFASRGRKVTKTACN